MSVVIPCLDEARTIGRVVQAAARALEARGETYEIIVADNGSTDGSIEVARAAGATVIHASIRGVGAATTAGVQHSRGRIVVLLDGDGEHDPAELGSLVDRAGAERCLVLGARRYLPGASSLANRRVGTPALTFLLNRAFGTRVTDCNTGFRALQRELFDAIGVRTPGFEFCSEMIARAALAGVPVVEVSVTQHPGPDGRVPHLRRMRDGWRHLRTILLYAPDRVLLRPGIASIGLGALLFVPQLAGRIELGPLVMDIHLMILGALFLLVGVEMVGAAVIAATFTGARSRLGRLFQLDAITAVAAPLFALGLAADVAVVVKSGMNGFTGVFAPRLALAGTTGMALAVELWVLAFVNTVVRERAA